MLLIYLLEFLFVLEIWAGSPRQQDLREYRTLPSGQYLIHPFNQGDRPEIPRGYSPYAVVVLPRPVSYNPPPSKQLRDEYTTEPSLPIRQQPDNSQEDSYENPSQNIRPLPLNYGPTPIPFIPLRKTDYNKQQAPFVQQFLKEVPPTTRTMYEHQSSTVRYAQKAPPQIPEAEEDISFPRRYQQQSYSYIIPQGIQQNSNVPQVIYPQQYNIQQQFSQPQKYVQNQQYSGRLPQFIPNQEQRNDEFKSQNQNYAGLTLIPINSVKVPKPVLNQNVPIPKSAVYITQRTAINKPQRLQPLVNEEIEEETGKPQNLPNIPFEQQQQQQQQQPYLLPFFQQQLPLLNNQQVQHQIIKYQIQQLPPQILNYQHLQSTQQFQQNGNSKQLQTQNLPPSIVTLPIQQLSPQDNIYTNQPFQQLPNSQILNIPKQQLIRYQIQPQILVQQDPQNNIRPLQQQASSTEYETTAEESDSETTTQEETSQVDPKTEEKEEPIEMKTTTPRKLSAKYRKSAFRIRKPSPQTKENQEIEEDAQSKQETQHEDFRVRYEENLKSQATSHARVKYQPNLQLSSRYINRPKERSVQIIEEGEEYE